METFSNRWIACQILYNDFSRLFSILFNFDWDFPMERNSPAAYLVNENELNPKKTYYDWAHLLYCCANVRNQITKFFINTKCAENLNIVIQSDNFNTITSGTCYFSGILHRWVGAHKEVISRCVVLTICYWS